ncbi:hypothetical protein CVT25_011477 [Psilocybe cyanescens]|uniref:Uncharacterized protein n=1 Tax=Psilocybe cyanescens TaxID=93625 RepID=A0A409XAC9_PSICY|nr:hypothetical protein CVT25_011477 [Psilocybe cyanescens]
MWVIGAVIAAAGMQVFKHSKRVLGNRLLKPKFLMTSVFSASAVFLPWAAGNSLVFREYILLAANVDPTRWTLRLVAFSSITFSVLLHGTALK